MRTPRLILTPLTVEDADAMVAVLSAPELYAVIGGGPPTLSELQARYTRQLAGEGWHNLIVRTTDGEPIGYVQATVSGREAEVAWVIGLPWQGRGYAAEAASALAEWLRADGVLDLKAVIEEGHTASERVARHLGLQVTDEVEDGERVWRNRK